MAIIRKGNERFYADSISLNKSYDRINANDYMDKLELKCENKNFTERRGEPLFGPRIHTLDFAIKNFTDFYVDGDMLARMKAGLL